MARTEKSKQGKRRSQPSKPHGKAPLELARNNFIDDPQNCNPDDAGWKLSGRGISSKTRRPDEAPTGRAVHRNRLHG